MTIKEAVDMISYGTRFYIKGAYKGKVYYRSWVNKSSQLDKFADELVTDTPFFSEIIIGSGRDRAYSVIGIWMEDYHFYKEERR